MGWPQWTWIVLVGLSWLITLCKHGQPRVNKDGVPDKYDAGLHTAALGLSIFLLWQGGFFG